MVLFSPLIFVVYRAGIEIITRKVMDERRD